MDRTENSHETEDLALTFVEEEVGRYDWRNNWQAIRAAGVARGRLMTWLQSIHSEHDPDLIIQYLDRMVHERGSAWS